MMNHIAKRGADVIYGTMNPPIHVSGHGSAEIAAGAQPGASTVFRPHPRRIPSDGRSTPSSRSNLSHLGLEETFILDPARR